MGRVRTWEGLGHRKGEHGEAEGGMCAEVQDCVWLIKLGYI